MSDTERPERRAEDVQGRDRIVTFLNELRGKSPFLPVEPLKQMAAYKGIYTEWASEYGDWLERNIAEYGEDALAHLCLHRENFSKLTNSGIRTISSARAEFKDRPWRGGAGIGPALAHQIFEAIVLFDAMLFAWENRRAS